MTIELDSTLAQAEVLFLSFQQLLADIERRKAEESSKPDGDLRQRKNTQGSSKNPKDSSQAQIKLSTIEIGDELKELLQTKRPITIES